MDITITGKQIRVTPVLRRYIQERVQKAEKLLPPDAHLAFTLKKEKYRQMAEVHANVNGFILQAEEETDNLHAAVDQAMAKVERQLHRHKEKMSNHRMHRDERLLPAIRPKKNPLASAVRGRKGASTHAENPPPDRLPPIERETLQMAVLTLEEALSRMASEKKDLFLFRNRSDRQCCLLSKPSRGALRLIEVTG